MASIEQILVCRERWLDAATSGQPPVALVESTLRKYREAVARLGSHLLDLAYPTSTILLLCPDNLDQRVTRSEAQTGIRVPKIICEFWRNVGGISLVDLEQYEHVAF